MMRVRFFLEGEPHIAFLSDADRLTQIVDDHVRDHLANIRNMTVYYNHYRKMGIVEYSCDTEEDHYAEFPTFSFEFLGHICRITFENGFVE